MLQRLEQDHANGLPIRAFPPVRAGQKEIVPGSDSFAGNLFGANKSGPGLGKLAQHLMSNVLNPMEENTKKDREALENFLRECP